ncbi:IPT/TIG domain-containing protein [Streptomyces sp. NPDC051664]|uniref:IPT/TIG domain-containing protein n=1 Tax=Streptomyces sp. NPDC051664 TaxID=3365668 RepID=UPI0037AA24F5
MEISDPAKQAVRPSGAAAAPVLGSVVPNSALAAGSSTVTWNGSSFTGATAVNFDAAPALSYSVDSSAARLLPSNRQIACEHHAASRSLHPNHDGMAPLVRPAFSSSGLIRRRLSHRSCTPPS